MGDIIRKGQDYIYDQAAYRKITITVPEVPIEEPMPAAMIFYVDTRFTTADVNKIRTMIAGVLAFWRDYQRQLDETGSSRFQECSNRYARFNLAPVWYEGKLANGSAAAMVQMDDFTTLIAANGFNRAPRTYIMYKPAPANSTTIVQAVNGSNPETTSLSVSINPNNLRSTTIGGLFKTAALYHAWLHRAGYRHPAGKYTSYFAGEASLCVARTNNQKIPGQNDNVYTRYFD